MLTFGHWINIAAESLHAVCMNREGKLARMDYVRLEKEVLTDREGKAYH